MSKTQTINLKSASETPGAATSVTGWVGWLGKLIVWVNWNGDEALDMFAEILVVIVLIFWIGEEAEAVNLLMRENEIIEIEAEFEHQMLIFSVFKLRSWSFTKLITN